MEDNRRAIALCTHHHGSSDVWTVWPSRGGWGERLDVWRLADRRDRSDRGRRWADRLRLQAGRRKVQIMRTREQRAHAHIALLSAQLYEKGQAYSRSARQMSCATHDVCTKVHPPHAASVQPASRLPPTLVDFRSLHPRWFCAAPASTMHHPLARPNVRTASRLQTAVRAGVKEGHAVCVDFSATAAVPSGHHRACRPRDGSVYVLYCITFSPEQITQTPRPRSTLLRQTFAFSL